jgi:hypothetical protein
MKLCRFDPDSATPAIQALTVIGRAARGGLGAPQRAFIDAVQQVTADSALDIARLAPITPDDLKRHFADATQALQLVRFMVVTCLANGLPAPQQISLLKTFADALRVAEPAIGVIAHLAKANVWRFRLAFLRRSHLRLYFRNTYRTTGSALKVVKAVLIFRGVVKEDAALVSRYRVLEQLPEASLGHQLHRHLTQAGLPFPGEHGGLPEGAIFHDFAHVLAGFDTSPEGEMQAAAFQAGFTQPEFEFFTWLFSIVLHTTGINLLPFAIPLRPGRIGEGSIAMDVLNAMNRGAAVTTDLGANWNFWSEIALPLEVVRERLGIRAIEQPFDCDGRTKPGVVMLDYAA